MVGLAAGDALGATLEFEPPRPKDNLHREMLGGGAFRLQPGEWTDDTHMALCISKSLRRCEEVAPDDIARRFVRWFESDPPYMGIHTRAVLSLIADGVSWYDASLGVQTQNPSSAGNGSLMRTAPLALFAACQEADVISEWSRTVSVITHPHEECQWACVALNVAIVNLLRGATRQEALDAAIEACTGHSASVCERLVAASQPENTTSPTGHVLATLEVAFWALLHTESFEDSVVEVVNRGADADRVGAVNGALAGAYYGLDEIPPRWRLALERYDDLVRYANELHHLAVGAYPVPALVS